MFKKDKFIKNSLILTLSNSTMGILKFVFSIILSKDLGAEGMGLYSIIMPIYDLLCCLVCGGLISAISKEGSVFFSKGDYNNLNNSVKALMLFDFIFSCIIAILFFLISPIVSKYLIKDTRALHSLQILCVATIFVAISSIIKGYFYGISHVSVPAIIDIVEKAIRISVVIALINSVNSKNITRTVTTVYLALAIGEFVSFVLLYIFYLFYRNKYSYSSHKCERKSQLLFNILITSIPLCINGFLTSALSTISTLIVPVRLVAAGFSHSTALSMIGKFTGMAINIPLFPIIVISSMSIALIPDISESLSNKDYYALEKRIEGVIRFSILTGIATLLLCFCIPTTLGKLFYNRNDLGNYIKFSSISIPFIFASVTTFSVLSGLGKQKGILKISLLTSFEELLLLYILAGIHSINIYSCGISITITSITSLILNLVEIKKCCDISLYSSKLTIDILVCILTFLILLILNSYLPNFSFNIKPILLLIFVFTFLFSTSHFLNKKTN